MCYDEGMIQAYIDGELSPEESKEVCKHLEICEKCRRKYDEMSAVDAFVEEKLAVEEKAFNFLCKDEAWDRFNRRPAKSNIEKGVFYMINRYKKIAAGAAAAVLISSIIWVAPVRNAAADFLSIFRVSKFKTITFTADDIAQIQFQLEEKGIKNIDLKQYGNITVDGGDLKKEIRFEEGSPEDAVKSALQSIKDEAGVEVLLPEVPDGLRLASIQVTNPANMKITPNVKNLNQLISLFGGVQYFPEALDGRSFEISIKSNVRIYYESSVKGKSRANYWMAIEKMQSPDVTVPDGVNLEAVRDAVISLPFMPENVRRQLADIKDWKNTLPLPVEDGADVRNIVVNGNQGILISGRHNNFAAWSDGKFMYWINTSLPEEQVLQIAESLR
ncbi:DUF4367 domain-containing protein [Thermoanaerobacteraceae bacterium SP2]|nr:DUF4367 domain-containing protein [Thermoanaerobacteraceae bacterium SP2]